MTGTSLNSAEDRGWPFLISASRFAPTRLLLAPPIEAGIDAARLMKTGPRNQSGPTASPIPVGAIGDFEIFISETLLTGPELGEPTSFIPRDAFGRRIVVKRGVCLNRMAGVSPASLFVHAEEQFLMALRAAWLGGEDAIISQLLQGNPQETLVLASDSNSYDKEEMQDSAPISPLAPARPPGGGAWVSRGMGRLRRKTRFAIAIGIAITTIAILVLFLIAIL